MNIEQEFERRCQLAAAQLHYAPSHDRARQVAQRTLNLASAGVFLDATSVPRFSIYIGEHGERGFVDPTVDCDFGQFLGAAAFLSAQVARQECAKDIRLSEAAALLRLAGLAGEREEAIA